MRILITGAICIAMTAASYGASECDSVLRPNQEQMSSDYAVAQAYMLTSAIYEYDRLKNLDASTRSADATYKLFSAEYNNSESREKFQERVRQRLKEEGFSMLKEQSRALSRIYVSDSQVAAWASCQNSGAVLLSAQEPNVVSFTLRASFVPPIGIGSAALSIKLDGATIDGTTSISEVLSGKSSLSFIVKPVTNEARVVVVANIAGLSDALSIDLRPRAHKEAPVAQRPDSLCTHVSLNVDIRNLDGTSHAFGGWQTVDAEHWATTPVFQFSIPGSESEKKGGARWRCSAVQSGTAPNCKTPGGSPGIVEINAAILNLDNSNHWSRGFDSWKRVPAMAVEMTEAFGFRVPSSASQKRLGAAWRCFDT